MRPAGLKPAAMWWGNRKAAAQAGLLSRFFHLNSLGPVARLFGCRTRQPAIGGHQRRWVTAIWSLRALALGLIAQMRQALIQTRNPAKPNLGTFVPKLGTLKHCHPTPETRF